jgi:hypothetical protein
MPSVEHATGNLWKHLKKHEIYYKDYKDDLKGFKDAVTRTRTENRERRIHHDKYSERDSSIISMLERPTAVIEKAFLEFIVGTRQPFQVVELSS